MAEFLFDDDPQRTQYIRPDATGFTLRTEFKGTQGVLDANARARGVLPTKFGPDGERLHLVGRVPIEVYEEMFLKLGRHPNRQELLALLRDRDFSKLKARDVKV